MITMERDEKAKKIKKELRSLRKINKSIEASFRMRSKYEKRLNYLKNNLQAKEAERVQTLLAGLKIDEQIIRATEMEAKYMTIIDKLEPIDRTIIIDACINGKTYLAIGMDVGYSEEGVRKRIDRICYKIADFTMI